MPKLSQAADKHQTIQLALLAVMRDVGAIPKSQENKFHGYKFRGIDDVMNALHGAFVRHGVVVTPQVKSHEISYIQLKDGKPAIHAVVGVSYQFCLCGDDATKDQIAASTVYAEGIASDDKATNKAMSAAYKYAMLQTFCIPTEDMAEADAESPEIGEGDPQQDLKENAPGTATKAQIATLRQLADQHEEYKFGKQKDVPFKDWVEQNAKTLSYAQARRTIEGVRKRAEKGE